MRNVKLIYFISLILIVFLSILLSNTTVNSISHKSSYNSNNIHISNENNKGKSFDSVSLNLNELSKTKYIQVRLKQYGFYKGALDGILGNETMKALSDYRVSISEDKYKDKYKDECVVSNKSITSQELNKINIDNPNNYYLTTKDIENIINEVNSRPDLSPYVLDTNYSPDITSIKQHGILFIGMLNSNRLPFFSGVKSSLSNLPEKGIDVDLIHDIAKGLNVDICVNISANTFDDLVKLLVDKKVDMVVSKLSITKERIPSIMFTNPYAILRRAIITKRKELPRNISVMNDIEISKILYNYSGKVGVIQGSAYVNYIREDLPNAQVVELDTWNDVVKALTNQQVDMIYRDEVEMFVLLNNFPGLKDEYVVYSIRDKVDSIGIGLPNNSFGLLSYLNSLISTNGRFTNQKLLNRVSLELSKNKEDTTSITPK